MGLASMRTQADDKAGMADSRMSLHPPKKQQHEQGSSERTAAHATDRVITDDSGDSVHTSAQATLDAKRAARAASIDVAEDIG